MKNKPPTSLLEPRQQPEMYGDTWRDLAAHALELKQWGNACESDKSSIRAWANE